MADQHPGEGPFGGILTALASTDADVVVVLACDLPAVDPAPSRPWWTPSAKPTWPPRGTTGATNCSTPPITVGPQAHLQAAFAAGERAPRRAVGGLRVVSVTGLPPRTLADADTPDDLP